MFFISCLFFVTIKDKSDPPLKKFGLGFCLIISHMISIILIYFIEISDKHA